MSDTSNRARPGRQNPDAPLKPEFISAHRGDAIRPKMATDIPASITIPDSVETRLGTLEFADGFPEDATVEKVYDNLDFARSVKAFLTALPIASAAAIRAGLASVTADKGGVAIFESLADSRSLLLTANSDTVYAIAWLDLERGPIVVESPPNVLGFVNDVWSHYVTDLGNAGPDKGNGGKYLFLPPGYDGTVPEGYFVVRPKTFGNWLLVRGFLVDGNPRPAADAIKRGLRIYSLASASKPRPTAFLDVSGREFNTIFPTDESLFGDVNSVIQKEPVDGLDPETLGLLASVGIEKGRPFAPDERMKTILAEAAAVGSAIARTISCRPRMGEAYLYPNSRWLDAFYHKSFEFLVNGARQLDSRILFFFQAIGITPAMAAPGVGVGSQYAGTWLDSRGRAFDGSKTYRLHLPPNIPATKFWSVTLYDTQTRSELQTDQRFPSTGSQKPGLAINNDRSVDLYFGPTVPVGKEMNWVQTVPGKGWFTILRLYGPLESWFDKSWRPGEIEEIGGAKPPNAEACPTMATTIPSQITTPDHLETRIGTLNFVDGFPDEPTAQKAYDTLDFQRGVDAFLSTASAASMVAQRTAARAFGPANQTVIIFESLLDARSLFLTPNTESVYALAWLDLTLGPIVVETPPNTLGLVNDFWFQYVTDCGNVGPDEGRGGKFLILPPNYQGKVPESGYHVCRSKTFGNVFATRGFHTDGDTKPAVENIKRHLRIYPFGRPSALWETTFVNVSGRMFSTIYSTDFSFFEAINEVVQEEPSDAMDPEILGLLASIGIEKGKRFAPDERMTTILTEAAAVGLATARTLLYRSRLHDNFLYTGTAWTTPFIGRSYRFEQDGARLLDARTMFFVFATGISPAMASKMIGAGSQYAAAFVDGNGRRLDGGKHYHLRLPPAIPAKDLWSLVVYDTQTRSQLQTDQAFPSVGSRRNVESNADGSVDVYFGPTPIAGREKNWIQTIPEKGWFAVLRLYGPLEPWFTKVWRPGEIEQVR